MFHAGTCPKCEQGVRGFRSCGDALVLLCNECEAAWTSPEAATVTYPAQPDLPSPLTGRSLIGSTAHWCSREEIEAAGWQGAVAGELDAPEPGYGIDPLQILFGSPGSEMERGLCNWRAVAESDDRFAVLEPGHDGKQLEAVAIDADAASTAAEIELALRSKKHVLARLPWGDIRATRGLIALADEHHRSILPLTPWPQHARTIAIREAIDRGEIGSVKRVVIGRSESDSRGIESLLIEAVLAANWAFDANPTSGSTTALTADSACVTLEFDSGVGILDISDDLPKRQWIEIVGSNGSIVCDDFFEPPAQTETRFWIHDAAGSSETHTVDPADGQLATLVALFRYVRTGNYDASETIADATEVTYRLLNREPPSEMA